MSELDRWLMCSIATFLDREKEVQEIASSMEAVHVLTTAYNNVLRILNAPQTGSFYVSAGKAAELASQQQVSRNTPAHSSELKQFVL